jgi:Glyoxalase/Bleomycin resistance protein/Dioxygenase superfamily
MQVEGITWHGVILEPDQFAATKNLAVEVLGLTPLVEQQGWTLFEVPNGTHLDLFEPDSDLIPTYGFNDGIVFGFRVDDIEAAAADLQGAGFEVLCDIHRIPEMNYAYCHFRGPDGRVYRITNGGRSGATKCPSAVTGGAKSPPSPVSPSFRCAA